MTPGDLIREKSCTAACIAAVTVSSRCACPCRGQFHGVLASADITTLVGARSRGLHHLTDLEVIQCIS